jgi:endonuclease/exonuclease/phosphatase family metal-dependent hydrolase
MGDFNSNAIWDRDHPTHLNHSSVVARLARHGLVSAYHSFQGVGHGSETEFTYYSRPDQNKPFHIDYIFIPEIWSLRILRVEIGNFADWDGKSDHRPMLVEIADQLAPE